MTGTKTEKIGVVLFNLGGPDSLEAVEPFLYNLFQDPDIFTFPLASLLRKPLAKLISSRRAPKSRVYFEYMGGKSPITELTQKQADALEKTLNYPSSRTGEGDKRFKVVIAMRYWKPFTEDAIRLLQEEGIRKVILLPLFPQYSHTTTRSSLREWRKQCRKMKARFEKEIFIDDYHDHPLYIRSVAERIREAKNRFTPEEQREVHLLFSAHGIPLKEIRQGDPYDRQIRRSVELVMAELSPSWPHRLAYQSKVGPARWLEPSTVDVLGAMAQEGIRYVIAVPISFVSDHSETLYELKKLYGELAMSLGMKQYELMPALNDSPLFIEALKSQVLRALDSQDSA